MIRQLLFFFVFTVLGAMLQARGSEPEVSPIVRLGDLVYLI